LQQNLSKIEGAGATLVAVSPQTLSSSEDTRKNLDLTFPVLSDKGNELARQFGIVFRLPDDLREIYEGMGIDLEKSNGDESHELPLPATYIIGTDNEIKWRFVDPNHTNRAEPDDIAAVLNKL
jgi:peroxiredoxin